MAARVGRSLWSFLVRTTLVAGWSRFLERAGIVAARVCRSLWSFLVRTTLVAGWSRFLERAGTSSTKKPRDVSVWITSTAGTSFDGLNGNIGWHREGGFLYVW